MTTNLTPVFTPSLMQKLFGRNYKWWYLINYEFKRSSGHFNTFIINTSIRAFEFLAIIYIWKINNGTAEIITYLALGRVFGRLITSWLDSLISSLIAKGSLTRYLLYPSNPLTIITVGDFGFNFIRQVVNALVTVVLAMIIFKGEIIFSSNVFYLFPFLIIALTIKTYFSHILGFLSFWSKDSANTSSLIDAIRIGAGLLSGEVIPLFVLFYGFFNPIFWTPFSYFLHHPMQIYLGKYSPVETLWVFVGGLVWCVVLYFLAKWVFKLGLRRNESVGL